MAGGSNESTMATIDRARSHPLRRRILLYMREVDEPISATLFIKQVPFAGADRAFYHFQVLARAGLIDLVDERRVRGAVESFWRPSPAFTAELSDAVGLDRIAEIVDGQHERGRVDGDAFAEMGRILYATGRPVKRVVEAP
jgi:hypothetical protein